MTSLMSLELDPVPSEVQVLTALVLDTKSPISMVYGDSKCPAVAIQ